MLIKDLEPFLPEMVTLPKGQFVIGSQKGNESPKHTVQIPYALAVGKYPITFDQWDACVKDGGTEYSPPDFGRGRGNRPVINVSWNDIQPYLRWLSKVTGKPYRLLSEAEWEYAARAGSQTSYSFGNDPKELDRYAWFDENSGGKTHPVGEKLPNAFGLHDMNGNVLEWTDTCIPDYANLHEWTDNGWFYDSKGTWDGTADTTSDYNGDPRPPPPQESTNHRTARGGAWSDRPHCLRSADCSEITIASRYDNLGFRVARTD